MTTFFSRVNDHFLESKPELSELLIIHTGVFLFMLFFNPFGLTQPNLENQLLVTLGAGSILFFMMVLFCVVLPRIYPDLSVSETIPDEPQYIPGLIAWLSGAVALPFYLHYVGKIPLSIFAVFKIVVVCFVPVAVYQTLLSRSVLKQQIFLAGKKLEKLQSEMSRQAGRNFTERILIESENKSENVEVRLNDILLVRSADNYVELVYLDDGTVKKRLIRNTLKNIEERLSLFPDFLRCHRTTLINAGYVEKLFRSYSGVFIKLKGYEPSVPVSRQYLLKVKEIART